MHFTYQSPKDDLQQGDVLRRTPEIEQILQDVHPHYKQHGDYKCLIVLTQSCDLVQRRGGEDCKARYISLAAVRSFDTLFRRQVSRYQPSPREQRLGICASDKRILVRQFLERLFNNNEPNYFYLNEDPDLGLTEPSVAFLALSIAIKSSLHYETCRAARIAQLTDVFQHKLGWLVGNMYSRIGTPDWSDQGTAASKEFAQRIDDILDSGYFWIENSNIKKIIKEEKRLEKEFTLEEVRAYAASLEDTKGLRKEETIDRIVELVKSMESPINEKHLKTRLTNDPLLSKNLR